MSFLILPSRTGFLNLARVSHLLRATDLERFAHVGGQFRSELETTVTPGGSFLEKLKAVRGSC